MLLGYTDSAMSFPNLLTKCKEFCCVSIYLLMVNVFMIKILMSILGFGAGDEIAPNGLEKIVLPYHLA
jgi:hypothetical protein